MDTYVRKEGGAQPHLFLEQVLWRSCTENECLMACLIIHVIYISLRAIVSSLHISGSVSIGVQYGTMNCNHRQQNVLIGVQYGTMNWNHRQQNVLMLMKRITLTQILFKVPCSSLHLSLEGRNDTVDFSDTTAGAFPFFQIKVILQTLLWEKFKSKSPSLHIWGWSMLKLVFFLLPFLDLHSYLDSNCLMLVESTRYLL